MIIKFQFGILLILLLINIITSKEITKIKITTSEEIEEEAEEEEQNIEPPPQNDTKKKEVDTPQKDRYNAESSTEKMIQEAKKNAKLTTTEKSLILTVPYQDNEDYILSPLGLGNPINFIPVQVETTSYKTWVLSVLNEDNPSIFSYNLKDSKTAKESGDWDTVVDEEGSVNGNVIYDKAYLGKYKIDKFKFIEGVEFEENFKDFKIGKLGLGNCQYADEEVKEFCILEKLKNNGSIDKKIF